MSNASTTATYFWPASFEERGVAVPFTTPSVSMARVRNGERGKLEMLIPGVSGGRGVYVIGWNGVPETFKLTVFDRVLHERIAGIETVTPGAVQDAVAAAAVTGLAGEDTADAAHRLMTGQTENQLRVSLALTRHVLKKMLDVDLDISLAELASPDGQKQIQSQLGRIARTENISPNHLTTVMTEWGDALELLGVAGYKPLSRFRRVLENSEQFRSSFADWVRTGGIGEAHPARLITQCLEGSLPYWRTAFGEVDSYAADPRGTIHNWAEVKNAIEKITNYLPWLLDGWPLVFAYWDEAVRSTEAQRHAAVSQILGGLPILPRDEVAEKSHPEWMEMVKRLSLATTSSEQRRQGDIDLESMLRQETVLARALG